VRRPGDRKVTYRLHEQVGFLLRCLSQRHAAIHARDIGARLTLPQWAVLSKLTETGSCGQAQLGRLICADSATVKGVVDRLVIRGLIEACRDPDDARRRIVTLTRNGRRLFHSVARNLARIEKRSLAPLTAAERLQLRDLLKKLR
jgi:MarR family transcriptional regulator, lower aerobic nicotinate degradation pathway regulator